RPNGTYRLLSFWNQPYLAAAHMSMEEQGVPERRLPGRVRTVRQPTGGIVRKPTPKETHGANRPKDPDRKPNCPSTIRFRLPSRSAPLQPTESSGCRYGAQTQQLDVEAERGPKHLKATMRCCSRRVPC